MERPVHYLDLIRKLENQKWDLLAKYGQVEATKLWKPIDAKLDKLYKWYVKDYLAGNITPQRNFRVIKRENLD